MPFFSPKFHQVLRYGVSGACALVTNVALLYLCVQVFGLWYLLGTTIAFVGTVIVSFILQKFWTFRDHSNANTHSQILRYVIIALVNIVVNAGLMYLFVSVLHIQYLLAQILSSGTIAVYGFFLYRTFIFTSTTRP